MSSLCLSRSFTHMFHCLWCYNVLCISSKKKEKHQARHKLFIINGVLFARYVRAMVAQNCASNQQITDLTYGPFYKMESITGSVWVTKKLRFDILGTLEKTGITGLRKGENVVIKWLKLTRGCKEGYLILFKGRVKQ